MKNLIISFFLLFFVLISSNCGLNVPETPVDQTVIVVGLDGKPLQGKELKLSGNGGLSPSSLTVLTDQQGKANFKFGWEEYHESGAWNWYIDAKTDDNTVAINRNIGM